MKASLSIEAIGHNAIQILKHLGGMCRPTGLSGVLFGSPSDYERWGVWEITAQGGEIKQHGRADYRGTNSAGSRGVRIWYEIESGKRYRVRAPRSWKRTDEYFCTVSDDGEIVRE
jgi:hypothetical protein